jgi:hypothetical protein
MRTQNWLACGAVGVLVSGLLIVAHATAVAGEDQVARLQGGDAGAASGLIAYGFIRSDGTVSKATSNVSCVWNATYKRYEITIAGENYFWLNYSSIVTCGVSTQGTMTTNSVGGKLLVFAYDAAGNPVQRHFQFATFKPAAFAWPSDGGPEVRTAEESRLTDADVALDGDEGEVE